MERFGASMSNISRVLLCIIATGNVILGAFLLFAWSFITDFNATSTFSQMISNPISFGLFAAAVFILLSSVGIFYAVVHEGKKGAAHE
jgi:hypothetical protein